MRINVPHAGPARHWDSASRQDSPTRARLSSWWLCVDTRLLSRSLLPEDALAENKRVSHDSKTRGKKCVCEHPGEYHWIFEGEIKCLVCTFGYAGPDVRDRLDDPHEMKQFVRGLSRFTGIGEKALAQAVEERIEPPVLQGSESKNKGFGGQITFGKGGGMKGTASLKNWKKD
jgi:hypothetical protein